jgi:hypothetical protein
MKLLSISLHPQNQIMTCMDNLTISVGVEHEVLAQLQRKICGRLVC